MKIKLLDKFTSSSKLLIKEAEFRKIKLSVLYPRRLLKLEYRNHIEYIFNQQISKTSSVAVQICDNKDITKELLKKTGISVAEGFLIDFEKPIPKINKKYFPLVVKPLSEAHGDLVYTDVQKYSDLNLIFRKLKLTQEKVLVEHQFTGNDYRIFATRDKVIGIIKRVPANVVGDGKKTIQELIDLKNKDPRRCPVGFRSKTYVQIDIDEHVKSYLNKQKISLKDVPEKGKIVYLRKNANVSTGGDAIDFTDNAHSDVKKIAVQAIRSIPELCYGGVDIMTKDIEKPQGEKTYIVLEINANPGFNIHHFPLIGEKRDVAKEIINILFPEIKK